MYSKKEKVTFIDQLLTLDTLYKEYDMRNIYMWVLHTWVLDAFSHGVRDLNM